MSVLQSTMYNEFNPSHIRSRSYTEVLSSLKSSIQLAPLPQLNNLASLMRSNYVKKRSHSDLLRESSSDYDDLKRVKRSRTAPPSPPPESKSYNSSFSSKARSLSPFGPLSPSNSPKSSPVATPVKAKQDVVLPSISTALQIAALTELPVKLKPIAPTVSLDYFDTYKPNDENWRYELLDTINKLSKHFNLNQYNYLNNHASRKPTIDSRISSKITKQTFIPKLSAERKINFPYESNYTYLNQTYLSDVEKYPEYLELAQSLVQLARGPQHVPHEHPLPHQPALAPPYSAYTTAPAPLHYTEPPSPHYSPTAQYHPSYGHFQHNHTTPRARHPLNSSTLKTPSKETKFIPVTPPSPKSKSRLELLKSPPKLHSNPARVCISCGSDQSPCWRPSWAIKEGQLCNSCGLRYKKTAARCLNKECKKIPAKGEWSLMQSKGKVHFEDGSHCYSCLDCGYKVEVRK